MGLMYGASPEQLDDLGNRMTAAADRLERIRSEVTVLLRHSHWEGGDADQFRGLWDYRLSAVLHSAAVTTHEGATRLHINARQQRDASAIGGGLAARGHDLGSFFRMVAAEAAVGMAVSHSFGKSMSKSVGREMPEGVAHVTAAMPLVGAGGAMYSTGRVDDGGQLRLGYADASAGGVFGLNGNLVGAGFTASAALGLAAYRRHDSSTIGGQKFDTNVEVSAGARVQGDGFVGVRNDHGQMSAGGKVGGHAFIGTEAHGSIETTLPGDVLGLRAYGSAHVGAGADAGATAMFENGKLVLGAHIGGAIGLGVSEGFEVSVDVDKLGEYGSHAVDGTVRLAEGAMDGLHKGWNGFWSTLPN